VASGERVGQRWPKLHSVITLIGHYWKVSGIGNRNPTQNYGGILDFFFLNIFFWCAPFGYLYFLSFQLLNEPGLGVGIDPGMALTPFPSSIG